MSAVEFWRGEFGDSYTDRNAVTNERISALSGLWRDILPRFHPAPESILEIGANVGANLTALTTVTGAKLMAVDPNAAARLALKESGIADVRDGTAAETGFPDGAADLVFTSGVLIHVPPSELEAAYAGIYRASRRYIICIEYFSDHQEEVTYRGHSGKLWKRDFGGLWLDLYPDLKPMGHGFCWKRVTGLDNLTFWAFSK